MTSPSLPSTDRIQQARVLVVGDVMLDEYWFGQVERISPEAPVPIAHIQRREYRAGGAANVAHNIAAMGGQATVLGVVGTDASGAQLRHAVTQARVTDALIESSDCPTIVKLRILGRQQQLLRADFETLIAGTALTALAQQFEALLASHDVLVLSDYAKGTLAQIAPLIAAARARGMPVLVDPKGTDYARYTGASLLTPNRAEFKLLAGAWADEAELTLKAQAFVNTLKLDALLITRSDEGMTLFTASDRLHAPSLAQDVYDVSGAGDTVIATTALMMAAGVDLHQAVRFANAAAGVVVKKVGTSTCSLAELAAALDSISEIAA